MALVQIGSKYSTLRDELREDIRLGRIHGLEAIAENHTCYFCSKSIQRKMYKVEREVESGKEVVFIDIRCYREAQEKVYVEGVGYMVN